MPAARVQPCRLLKRACSLTATLTWLLLASTRRSLLASAEEAEVTIEVMNSGTTNTRFIPMPNPRPNDIEYSFFMPISTSSGTAFDLLLLCRGDYWFGFRFEPADRTTHEYGHIQMNRRMRGGEVCIPGPPEWLPTSYPAFPLRTSEPMQMFLSMIVSIHGYPKFMDDVLKKTIAAPGRRQVVSEMLQSAMI